MWEFFAGEVRIFSLPEETGCRNRPRKIHAFSFGVGQGVGISCGKSDCFQFGGWSRGLAISRGKSTHFQFVKGVWEFPAGNAPLQKGWEWQGLPQEKIARSKSRGLEGRASRLILNAMPCQSPSGNNGILRLTWVKTAFPLPAKVLPVMRAAFPFNPATIPTHCTPSFLIGETLSNTKENQQRLANFTPTCRVALPLRKSSIMPLLC